MTHPTTPGVYLYEHINYQGRMLHVTQSLPDLGDFNKQLSSWMVIGDFSGTVFEHANYSGRRSTLYSGSACPDIRQKYVPGGIVPGCDGEVENDMASSIGVGTAFLNDFDSRFYWPRGAWVFSVGSSGTISWRFYPDRSYQQVTLTPDEGITVRGRWNDARDPWGLRAYIVTRENHAVSTKGYNGPYPDKSYQYRFHAGRQAVDINMVGPWMTFNYFQE